MRATATFGTIILLNIFSLFISQSFFVTGLQLNPNPFKTICTTSQGDCNTQTNNCHSRGSCQQRTGTGAKCFQCKCNYGFTGSQCESTDYTYHFHLIFWTSLFMIGTVIMSVVLLQSVDPEGFGK
jgi:hypothetical protein